MFRVGEDGKIEINVFYYDLNWTISKIYFMILICENKNINKR